MIFNIDNCNSIFVHYKTIGRQIFFVSFCRKFDVYKMRNIVFKRQNNKEDISNVFYLLKNWITLI